VHDPGLMDPSLMNKHKYQGHKYKPMQYNPMMSNNHDSPAFLPYLSVLPASWMRAMFNMHRPNCVKLDGDIARLLSGGTITNNRDSSIDPALVSRYGWWPEYICSPHSACLWGPARSWGQSSRGCITSKCINGNALEHILSLCSESSEQSFLDSWYHPLHLQSAISYLLAFYG
jgi:hypothetical protein